MAEQMLNKTTSDNPVRGRPVGAAADAWEEFHNPGRAASELQKRFPSKTWDEGNIGKICDGTRKTQHGWEFQWVDAANVVGARADGWWKDRAGAARPSGPMAPTSES